MIKRVFLFILLALVALSGVHLWVYNAYEIEQYPIPAQVKFDDYIRTDYRGRIDAEKPEVIILGDSAVRNVDEDVFSNSAGRKTMLFSTPGSASAYWYLFIRNVLYPASHRPEYFILFFRETSLTIPDYLVLGDYFSRIDEIALPEDADVYHLAVNLRKGRLERFAERFIPLFTYRSEIYLNTITWFRNLIPNWLLGLEADEVSAAYDAVFDDEHINDLLWEEFQLNVDASLYEQEEFEFADQVTASFLPAMVRDLRSMGITPVFVRVRYRSHAEGEPDSREMMEYLQSLEKYLLSRGAVFIDMSTAEGLTTDMYTDNFHLDADRAGEFSRVMAEEILPFLSEQD